jgi:hypothetical protein
MLFSGELSITSVVLLVVPDEPDAAGALPVPVPVALGELVELEQAARVAARRPAAVSAAALLLLNLLVVNFDLPS